MLSNFKNHRIFVLYIIFPILFGCQIQEPTKNHGILFLENRSNKLVLNVSNQNDVVQVIGQPHSKSISNENIWLYVERTLTKGKYHKLGRHVLKSNNTLVLSFNKYGILTSKKFYKKDDLQKMNFSKKTTENKMTKRSFVESFLSSIKQKMYGNKGN